MPIYEYRRPDGTTFEVLQSFSDEPLSTDPETGVAVQRVLHAPAVHFKGSGFYNTDYGTRKRQRENQSDSSGSAGGEAKSGGESKQAADGAGKGESSPAGSGSDTPKKDASAKKAEPVAA